MTNDRAIEVTLDDCINHQQQLLESDQPNPALARIRKNILTSLRDLKRIRSATMPGPVKRYDYFWNVDPVGEIVGYDDYAEVLEMLARCRHNSSVTMDELGEIRIERDIAESQLARERERADANGSEWAKSAEALVITVNRADLAEAKLAKVMEGLRETYEIYAGMEGIPLPKFASEAYLLRIIDQMQKSVTALLRGEGPFDDLVDKELSK